MEINATSTDPVILFTVNENAKITQAYSYSGDYFYLRDDTVEKDRLHISPSSYSIYDNSSSSALSISFDDGTVVFSGNVEASQYLIVGEPLEIRTSLILDSSTSNTYDTIGTTKDSLFIEGTTIYHDANTHYFRESDGTFVGSTIKIQNTGDVYLSLEADTNANDVEDNPLIQFKKRNVELANIGLISDNTFVISSSSSSQVKVEVGGSEIVLIHSDGVNITGNTLFDETLMLLNTSSSTIDRIKTTKDTLLLDTDGGANMELTKSGAIYFDGTAHYFRDYDGSPTYLTLSSSLATIATNVNITGSNFKIYSTDTTIYGNLYVDRIIPNSSGSVLKVSQHLIQGTTERYVEHGSIQSCFSYSYVKVNTSALIMIEASSSKYN